MKNKKSKQSYKNRKISHMKNKRSNKRNHMSHKRRKISKEINNIIGGSPKSYFGKSCGINKIKGAENLRKLAIKKAAKSLLVAQEKAATKAEKAEKAIAEAEKAEAKAVEARIRLMTVSHSGIDTPDMTPNGNDLSDPFSQLNFR